VSFSGMLQLSVSSLCFTSIFLGPLAFPKTMCYGIQIESLHSPDNLVILLMSL
jgi:hypothetical protein